MQMLYIVKNDKKFPFSRGIFARSLTSSGLSLEKAYEIANKTREELTKAGKDVILSTEMKEIIADKLSQQGYKLEKRNYLVRSAIKNSTTPLFIMIGGGSGVGKSTISAEIGHRLGITRVVSTDTVREIMRSIISKELIPTLHSSSFEAGDSLQTPLVEDRSMYAFQQQASLVCEGVIAVMRRAIKEGLKMVINGVHLIPGFIRGRLKLYGADLLQYILDIPDVEQHKNQFYERERGSLRDPERYIRNIDNIRNAHRYILTMAKRNDVRIIKNTDFETSLREILEDAMGKLEGRLKA
jgi:2-phosphoglycerate kinase